jgi:hypothetical protein
VVGVCSHPTLACSPLLYTICDEWDGGGGANISLPSSFFLIFQYGLKNTNCNNKDTFVLQKGACTFVQSVTCILLLPWNNMK